MADVITWETCPRCGGLAAFGWEEGTVVEFDCPAGCTLTEADWAEVRDRSDFFAR
jgi:hypothetical protein